MRNHERIGKALNALRKGLYEYVVDRMQKKYGGNWTKQIERSLRPHQKKQSVEESIQEDVSVVLTVINKEWNGVFKDNLSHPDRALVNELIEVRNQWAHQSTFSTDDTYRAVDSVLRLLKSISASQVADVEKQRQEILRLLSQEQTRYETRLLPISSAEESRIRKNLNELLQQIPFQNAYLLKQALTHTSYKYENPNTGEDNEQLEFLGDALLTFLSGDFLYKSSSDLKEGDMSKLRSNLVDKPQLAKFASDLELGKWIKLGKGEDRNGGRNKSSLLSNVFEAVIGAYYLDSGIEAVRDLVEPCFEKVVNDLPITEDLIPKIKEDVKGWLQQIVLDPIFFNNPNRKPPDYETIRWGGTDDNPKFISTVSIAGKEYGEGIDRSKKEAEKRAAENALKKLGCLN